MSTSVESTLRRNAPTFSVVSVVLNAGEDLLKTAQTVLQQQETDLEYIIKDGGSTDFSVDRVPRDARVKVVVQPDRSIFDAMNQSVPLCSGRYIIFMNAGDGFASPTVLREVHRVAQASGWPEMLYTDHYNLMSEREVHVPSVLTRRYLYRRVPCHQSIYIAREAFARTGLFEHVEFPILADNNHVLELLLRQRMRAVHVPIVGNFYKDGGFYTKPGNFRKRERERARLLKRFFTLGERLRWGSIYGATLPSVRSWLLMRYPRNPLMPVYRAISRVVNRISLFRS